jgi:hypothetical protein
MFGEKIFLFVWALVSQTKDVLLDYTTDIIQYLSATQKPRGHKKKPRQISLQDRRRRAYFRRLRHQMGVYTPDKDKHEKQNQDIELNAGGDELDNIAANLQQALGEDDKQSKLEDLESQLMELKQQLAVITGTGKASPQKQLQPAPVVIEKSKMPPPTHIPSMMNNHVNIAASIKSVPPAPSNVPPPPPPMPAVLTQKSTNARPLSQSIPAPTTPSNTNRMDRSMSLADIVRSAKDLKLRPTDVSRSPNGTPNRPKKPSAGFQSELFAAIKSKFKTINEEDEDNSGEPKKNNNNDDSNSDNDSDNFDTPPKKAVKSKNKENASPIGKRAASPLYARPAKPLHTINK